MELREVIGRRRSIRFLLPHRPVELDKIQRMLEAARIASHWGNVGSLRAIVIERANASPEVLEALPSPVAGYQIELAPVVIVWFIETAAVEQVGERLRELIDVGAIGYGPGRREEAEGKLIPIMQAGVPVLKQPGLGELDCGQGIAQATLMAYELGLGTCCLGTPNGPELLKILGVPPECRVLVLQTVGYPLEHWEAGGQRPRQPFGELFQMNHGSKPFPRSEKVVGELTEDRMFTRPAPLPDREAELAFLQKALNLKAPGLL